MLQQNLQGKLMRPLLISVAHGMALLIGPKAGAEASWETHETAAHISECLQVVITRDEIGEDIVLRAEGQGPPMVAFEAECCVGIRIGRIVLGWIFFSGCWRCLVAVRVRSMCGRRPSWRRGSHVYGSEAAPRSLET